MENIKAIIFDFDNTLADRTKASYQTYCYFMDQYMPEYEKGSVEREAVLQDFMIWDMFGNYKKTFINEALENKYGVKLDFDFGKWWRENQYHFEDLYPDTVETIEYLKSKGYKLGVLTNGDGASQRAKVTKTHLDDYMDEMVVCGEHDFSKPQKAAFDCICQKLGVKNEEAVFVGDIYSNDVLGAYRAGLIPIWIWPDGVRWHSDSVKRIDKISELKEIF